MKKRILFIVAVAYFCFIGNGLAQGPGFMGKHFYVKYDLGFSADGQINGGRFRHNFSFNYILHKRFSVGISYNSYRLGVLDRPTNETELTDIPVRELGFNIRAYLSSQYIAPVGTYFIAEVSNVNANLGEITENDFGATGISLGFGISRVLNNKFILDVSSTLGIITNEDFIPFDLSNEHPGLNSVESELNDFNVLNWRVGIGYLLF